MPAPNTAPQPGSPKRVAQKASAAARAEELVAPADQQFSLHQCDEGLRESPCVCFGQHAAIDAGGEAFERRIEVPLLAARA